MYSTGVIVNARRFGVMWVVLAAATVIIPASAADEDVDPNGRPKGFRTGLSSRYAVWHDAGVWHLRTTSADKDSHNFSGTIQVVGGKMTSLKPVSVEKGGKSKKNLDYGAWNSAGTLFTFSFTTGKNGHDGFDLQVSDKATELKFVFKVDGREVPEKIFLGAKNVHPTSATFSLPAHPGK
jgi:hypothetical protein